MEALHLRAKERRERPTIVAAWRDAVNKHVDKGKTTWGKHKNTTTFKMLETRENRQVGSFEDGEITCFSHVFTSLGMDC